MARTVKYNGSQKLYDAEQVDEKLQKAKEYTDQQNAEQNIEGIKTDILNEVSVREAADNALQAQIGNLERLKTDYKDNVVEAINSLFDDTLRPSDVDAALDPSSVNPIRNSVVAEKLNQINDALSSLTVDQELDASSTHPVANKPVTQAINEINTQMTGQIAAINQRISQQRSELDTVDEQLSNRIDANSNNIATLSDKVDEGSDAIEGIDTTIAELSNRITSNTESIAEDKLSISKNSADISTINGSITSIISDIHDLEQINGAQTERIDSNEQAINANTDAINQNKLTIEQTVSLINANTNAINQNKLAIEQNDRDIASIKEITDSLSGTHVSYGMLDENLIFVATQYTVNMSEQAFDGTFYEIPGFVTNAKATINGNVCPVPSGVKLLYIENDIIKLCKTLPPFSGLKYGKLSSVAANKAWFNNIEWIEWSPDVFEADLATFSYETPVINTPDRSVATQDVQAFVDCRQNAINELLDLRSAEALREVNSKDYSWAKTLLGTNWEQVKDNFNHIFGNAMCASVCQDLTNHKTYVFIGTDSNGLYRLDVKTGKINLSRVGGGYHDLYTIKQVGTTLFDSDLYYSTDFGDTWIAPTSLPTSSSKITATSIVVTGLAPTDIVAACGTLGVLRSTDGKTWTVSLNTTCYNLEKCTIGNTVYAIAGTSGSGLYYKPNGSGTWTQSNLKTGSYRVFSPDTSTGMCFASPYSNGLSDTKLYYTTNGSTWTASNCEESNVKHVKYRNGLYIQCGAKTRASIDGKTWQLCLTEDGDTFATVDAVYYTGASKWIGVLRGRSFVSDNGYTWKVYDSKNIDCEFGSVYGNDKLITVSSSYGVLVAGENVCLTQDGEHFDYLPNTIGLLNNVEYFNNMYIFVSYGKIYTSPDRANWSSYDSPDMYSGSIFKVHNALYYTGTDKMYVSYDGLAWQEININATKIVNVNGIYYARTTDSIYKSTDGLTFIDATDGITIQSYDKLVVVNNLLFLTQSFYVTDGGEWYKSDLPDANDSIGNIWYMHNMYFCMKSGYKLYKSYDGKHWVSESYEADKNIIGVYNGMCIAYIRGFYKYTTDMVNWFSVDTSKINDNLAGYSITYANGVWIGFEKVTSKELPEFYPGLCYSKDGITWYHLGQLPFDTFNDKHPYTIKYIPEKSEWLAVRGNIYYSDIQTLIDNGWIS